MSTHYPITGIKVDDPNNVPSRFEIQEWYQKAMSGTNSEAALQLSLFLHALERFQDEKFLGANVKEKDAQLSYFRVAGISQLFLHKMDLTIVKGIHGAPVVPWDGSSTDSTQRYFCAHNKSTFPTWHRPYLALYEVEILGIKCIVNLLDSKF
jgi:tyrosinase